MKDNKPKKLFMWFRNASSLLILVIILGSTLSVQPAQAAMHQIYITNVRDTSFTVSWTTDELTPASLVEYGLTTSLGLSKSDAVLVNTTVHSVTITELNPNTEYFYRVNGGEINSIITAPDISPPGGSITIFGTVYQSDGITPVQNAVVYLRLQDTDSSGSPGNSQWLSARTDEFGDYFIALLNARTEDLTAYFSFSTADEVQITGQGGSFGTRDVIPQVNPPASFLIVDIALDDTPNAIQLSQFTAYPESRNTVLVLGALGVVGLSLFAVLSRPIRRFKRF